MNDDIKWKIDAEIEKDKRVTELKWENQKLKEANDYLQEKLYESSKNISINHYHSECVELRRICNQLQSNWNSLREWLENEKLQMEGYFDTVLDKMNELERKDKNEISSIRTQKENTKR